MTDAPLPIGRLRDDGDDDERVIELRRRLRGVRVVAFDFDGVFTDNTVYVSEDGTESVRCWRSDGIGLRLLEAHGVEPLIVSTEVNDVVATRSEKLRLRCHHGCEDKIATLTEILEARELTLEQAAFVGNDVNDLDCLRRVAVSIVVADAHPSVVPAAALRTSAPGGRGAVREVCDVFAHVLSDGRG